MTIKTSMSGGPEAPTTSVEFDHERFLLEITEAICEELERKDVSRAELARRLGKNRAWVTRLLSHRGNPTTTSLVEVSRALGLRWRVALAPNSSKPVLILTQDWKGMKGTARGTASWSPDKEDLIPTTGEALYGLPA